MFQIGRLDTSGAMGKSIEEDAPELDALLAQLLSSLQEVRSRIGPLVKEVRPPLMHAIAYALSTPLMPGWNYRGVQSGLSTSEG